MKKKEQSYNNKYKSIYMTKDEDSHYDDCDIKIKYYVDSKNEKEKKD